jgi:hypothetical protein
MILLVHHNQLSLLSSLGVDGGGGGGAVEIA